MSSILKHQHRKDDEDTRYTTIPHPARDVRFLLILVKLSGMKAKDRVLVWRRVNEIGATPIIRSAFTLMDDKDGRVRAENLVNVIEEKGGRVWLFSVEPHIRNERDRIEEIIKRKMESEIREFVEECDEFIQDVSKELKEEEFEFYELEELGDDLHKLEKWKMRLIEKYSHSKDLYERVEAKLQECTKLLKTFEKKCVENREKLQ